MVANGDFVGPEAFVAIGFQMFGLTLGLFVGDGSRRFRALFRNSFSVCCSLWVMFGQRCPENSRPYNILRALMFLQVYAFEHFHAAFAGVGEKTNQK